MPLKRHSHKCDEDLRRCIGRHLITMAQLSSLYSGKKVASQAVKAAKIAVGVKGGKKTDPTEPASGTFSRPSSHRLPRARVHRDAWIPVNVSLAETEERLSVVYETKGIPDNARQLIQDVLSVVEEKNLLGGFSATVAVCGTVFLVQTALGKDMLTKHSVVQLPIRTEAVAAAVRMLAWQGDNLDSVFEPYMPPEGNMKRQVGWLRRPKKKIKAMWSPPGPSHLREVIATDDVSGEEHEEALRQLAQDEAAREEQRSTGEQFGRRPRRAARVKC